MGECYFPLDDEHFAEALKPLYERHPKAMAFLHRIGCAGLLIDVVGSRCITLEPLMKLGADREPLSRTAARALSMTDKEAAQFVTKMDEPDRLIFTEAWEWSPLPAYRQRIAEAELAAEMP